MRVVYFGSHEFAVPSLVKLARSGHDVPAVVTLPLEPSNPDAFLKTPVALQAGKIGLPIIECRNPNHPELIENLAALEADLGIVAASNQEFSESLRGAFKQGCVGIHPSLLPKYRGPSPIARCLLNGETRAGVTIFRLADGPDAGPILVQRETMIRAKEIWLELAYRLARIACDAIDAALVLLMEKPGFEGIPQDDSKASWAPVLKHEEGFLNFEEPASLISAKVRAMWPFPGAFFRYVASHGDAQDLGLVSASAREGSGGASPGVITEDFLVGTESGLLEIHALELPDDKLISWNDFIHEYRVSPGDRLESVKP